MIDNTVFSNPTASFLTFGCKLNYAETATIAEKLQSQGVRAVTEDEHPDVLVVNTCSVTSVADRKCRQAINSYHRRHPDTAIIVTGCYAQLKPEDVKALPGVAMVVGNNNKTEIPAIILDFINGIERNTTLERAADFRKFEPSCSRGNRTRYFLKVQDGCNYFCSYCTIPYARGRSRCPSIASLVDQARGVAAMDGKEIVLTGVNIGHFGWGTDSSFIDLLKELEKVDGIARYRISSIEPELLTDEIIDFVAASGKFMPHFHVPLQSGSDAVLKLMRRHYDTNLFAEKMEKIKSAIPHAFIGVDLIVGMRGESRDFFNESLRFVESLPISRLHVFPYSERSGTAALDIPLVVDNTEKKARLREMLDLSCRKEEAFSKEFISAVRPVLFERFDSETSVATGHTDNYIHVEVPLADSSVVNTIREVKLGEPRRDINEGYISKGTLA